MYNNMYNTGLIVERKGKCSHSSCQQKYLHTMTLSWGTCLLTSRTLFTRHRTGGFTYRGIEFECTRQGLHLSMSLQCALGERVNPTATALHSSPPGSPPCTLPTPPPCSHFLTPSSLMLLPGRSKPY